MFCIWDHRTTILFKSLASGIHATNLLDPAGLSSKNAAKAVFEKVLHVLGKIWLREVPVKFAWNTMFTREIPCLPVKFAWSWGNILLKKTQPFFTKHGFMVMEYHPWPALACSKSMLKPNLALICWEKGTGCILEATSGLFTSTCLKLNQLAVHK